MRTRHLKRKNERFEEWYTFRLLFTLTETTGHFSCISFQCWFSFSNQFKSTYYIATCVNPVPMLSLPLPSLHPSHPLPPLFISVYDGMAITLHFGVDGHKESQPSFRLVQDKHVMISYHGAILRKYQLYELLSITIFNSRINHIMCQLKDYYTSKRT